VGGGDGAPPGARWSTKGHEAVIERRVTRSGARYEVRLRGPDGKERSKTFRTRKEAERYERAERSAQDRGLWVDPRAAGVSLSAYAAVWMAQRTLRPRTVELYKGLLTRHILPTFGSLALGRITPASVRAWHADLAARHPTTAAKAYRLLSAILKTAVADEHLARNPCVVAGAATERAPERPTASVAEVAALAENMPERMRVAVLLAAWCQLRRAEILGLERQDLDLLHERLQVRRVVNRVKGGLIIGPPKTEAGLRTLTIPPHLLPELHRHLDTYVAPEPSAPVLTGTKGGRLAAEHLHQAFVAAREAIGRPDLHFHDLRHSGATWLAIGGATTKELQARVGHASPAAALRYQHATADRDAALAAALSAMAEAAPITPISHRPRDIRGMTTTAPSPDNDRQAL